MEYRQLGNSDIRVSEICLGSMTWATQNSEADLELDVEVLEDIQAVYRNYPIPY